MTPQPGMHQVLGGAAPWDAITNHALAAQQVIRGMGFRSEIFADRAHISPAIAHRVIEHHRWPAVAAPGDRAIVHYSIDSPAFDMALDHADRVGMHHHNVTPPELLWRDAPAVALQCQTGIAGLEDMAPRIAIAAADSAFNAGELRLAGYTDPVIIGILRGQIPRRERRRPPKDTTLRMLFVGRGIPNKRQDALILTLAALREGGVNAELRLVGGWGACRPYLERCRRLAAELEVDDHVVFLGAVDDSVLAGEYADADIFVCLSQHEGYCVPIIEAMANDLPIVALAAGAVPETLGHGGLLIDSLQPSLAAEAVLLATSGRLGERFAEGRTRQLAMHSPSATANHLRAFVKDLAEC